MVDIQAKPLTPPTAPDRREPPPERHTPDWGVLLAALLTLFAVGPLLYPGFFASQRGLFAPYEVVGLAQRPVGTWLPTLAGDPTLAHGPLPYWAARLVLFSGLTPTEAVKVVVGMSLLLASVGTYVLARRIVRRADDPPEPVSWPALVAAAMVAGLPALAGAAYQRGDLAEVWAIGILPLALWTSLAASRAGESDREPDVPTQVAGALLWAAVGLANVGLMLAGLLVLVALRPRREGWASPAGGIVLGGAVWAVIASRQPFTLSPPPIVRVDLAEVFAPVVAEPRAGKEPALLLGGVAALTLLLAFAPLGIRRPIGLAVVAAALTALSLGVAAPLWERLPAIVSQPYQLLGVAGLALALVGAQLMRGLGLGRPMAATAIVVLALVAGAPAFTARPLLAREPNAYAPHIVDRTIVLLETGLQVDRAQRGGTITVLLVWQGRQPVGRDLTVFTHLQNSAHVVVAQHDGPPVDGRRPTSGWRPGEVHLDFHRIAIPADLPPGRYQVVAGMYVPATGDRVGILAPNGQTSDAILLGEVDIR